MESHVCLTKIFYLDIYMPPDFSIGIGRPFALYSTSKDHLRAHFTINWGTYMFLTRDEYRKPDGSPGWRLNLEEVGNEH